MTIKIDDLTSEITMALREYTDDVTDAILVEMDDRSKEFVKQLRARSPKRKGGYAKGWTRKKTGAGTEVLYTIYNKDKPWLAHLLEKGHAKRGGGRVAGKPHIGPVHDTQIPLFERNVEEIIKRGGR